LAIGGKPIIAGEARRRARASGHHRCDGPTPPDEELFGPVLQVYRVADFDHALDRRQRDALRLGWRLDQR
jgi:hypothetical protein